MIASEAAMCIAVLCGGLPDHDVVLHAQTTAPTKITATPLRTISFIRDMHLF
jgi:hypothetical protein